MPKEITTAFNIRGSIDSGFLTALTTATERMQQFNTQIGSLESQSKAAERLVNLGQKIDYTDAKMQGLARDTAEYEKTLAALSSYYAEYDKIANSLSQAGVNTFNLKNEQSRLNAELERSRSLRAGMASTIEDEAAAIRQLAQAYAEATQQLARMNAQEQARVNGTYQAWRASSPQNINIPGADNINYSASSVEGSLYNAYEQAQAQEAARLAYEQRKREEVAFNNWNADFEARQQANRIAQAQARTRLNVTSFMGGLGGFSFGGAAMSALGGVLPAYLGGAAVKGAFDLAKASVSEAMNFDVVISELRAYTSATERQTAALREVALDIGLNTVFTASEAAKAMTYLGKAGWTTGQIQSGIRGVMNLSAASGEDIASVASIVADAIGAFSPTGLTPADSAYFADVLAKTATRSNTDVGLIGETFRTSAPVAGALGYSIEDVSQMIGLMANVGIKGSRAGTTTRNILNAFASGFSITGAKLGDYTYSAVNADGSMKSLRQTIDELRVAFSKLSNEEKVAAANEIAGMRGYAGLLGILNATEEEYARLAEEIKNADGAAEEMADWRMDNLQGDVTRLSSAFKQLKITIGEVFTPSARGVVQFSTNVLRALSGNMSVNQLTRQLSSIYSNAGIRGADGGYYARGELAQLMRSNAFANDFNAATLQYLDAILADPNVTERVVASVKALKSMYGGDDDINDELSETADAYEEVAKAAEESFKEQFDLWEQAAEVIPKDIYDLMDAQESQIEYWKEYEANLDSLYERAGGIPGFAQFLKENATGTADSVALMAGLAEASDAEIKEFMRLYNEAAFARDNASQAQAGITVNVYVNGTEGSASATLTGAAQEIAETVASAIREIEDDKNRRSLIA